MVVLDSGTLFLVEKGYDYDIVENTLTFDVNFEQCFPFLYPHYDRFALSLFLYSPGYNRSAQVQYFYPTKYTTDETVNNIFISGLDSVQNGTYSSQETLLATLSNRVNPLFSIDQEAVYAAGNVNYQSYYRIKKAMHVVFRKPATPNVRLSFQFKSLDGFVFSNPACGQTLGLKISGVRYPHPRIQSILETPIFRLRLSTYEYWYSGGKYYPPVTWGLAANNVCEFRKINWAVLLQNHFYTHRYFKVVVMESTFIGANSSTQNDLIELRGLPLLHNHHISANNVTASADNSTIDLTRSTYPNSIYVYASTNKGAGITSYMNQMTNGFNTEYVIQIPEDRLFTLSLKRINLDGSDSSVAWPAYAIRGIIQLGFIPYL